MFRPIVLAFAAVALSAAAADQPNLVFILSDDLAQGDLGCYGQKLIQTPHLDRMAKEGTLIQATRNNPEMGGFRRIGMTHSAAQGGRTQAE